MNVLEIIETGIILSYQSTYCSSLIIIIGLMCVVGEKQLCVVCVKRERWREREREREHFYLHKLLIRHG